MRTRPRIAITSGEPAGIGPDLVVRMAQYAHDADIVAIADPELLVARAQSLGLPLALEPREAGTAARRPGLLAVEAVELAEPARCGILNRANAPYVIETLERACRGCLTGVFDAMVTAPVHKGVINEGAIPFSGHTEYLAQATGSGLPVMLLSAPGLRIALVTTHVRLADVSRSITRERVFSVLQVLAGDLERRLGISKPSIVVCGLNPHAGEDGLLGTEEIEHIRPAIEAMRARGATIRGPASADTVFIPQHLHGVDAVLAMYHDQALPVLKQRGFGQGVNITLGLPIIRTSVDHGTALALAGTGRVDHGSMLAAIRTAIELVNYGKSSRQAESRLARTGRG